MIILLYKAGIQKQYLYQLYNIVTFGILPLEGHDLTYSGIIG